MRVRTVIFSAALLMAALGARAADLVVWWEKGFYPQADEAVAEIIAAFQQTTGEEVKLVQLTQDELIDKAQAAVAAGQPPDFLFGTTSESWAAEWAYEDRLVELEGVLGPALHLFDADGTEASTLLNGKTDIPQEWSAFWSFWCDRVQPAVRKALGRNDNWGVGLPMSAVAVTDTFNQLEQFQLAYEAHWLGPDRRLQVDDPEIRAGMVKALEAYTLIWRKGCTPPDSTSWANPDNNKAFLAQTVVMTPNTTFSIPAALRTAQPDDYYGNAMTIDWPDSVNGQPLVIYGFINRAVVFKAGGNSALAEDFVRFLAEEGWLAHWIDFAGDQFMPPMRKLVEQPFWLDSSDPHRMRPAIQILNRAHFDPTAGVWDNEWRSPPIFEENVWGNAVHRVVTEGNSPEQAVDEAIARMKRILSE